MKAWWLLEKSIPCLTAMPPRPMSACSQTQPQALRYPAACSPIASASGQTQECPQLSSLLSCKRLQAEGQRLSRAQGWLPPCLPWLVICRTGRRVVAKKKYVTWFDFTSLCMGVFLLNVSSCWSCWGTCWPNQNNCNDIGKVLCRSLAQSIEAWRIQLWGFGDSALFYDHIASHLNDLSAAHVQWLARVTFCCCLLFS